MSYVLITEGTVNYDGPENAGLVRVQCDFRGFCTPEDFAKLSKALINGLRFEVEE